MRDSPKTGARGQHLAAYRISAPAVQLRAHQNDLFPFWIAPDGDAKIERHMLVLPHSRDVGQQANLRRSLVLYRMVFGQNRQEDLVEYLASRLSPEEIEQAIAQCRIDLSPPNEA